MDIIEDFSKQIILDAQSQNYGLFPIFSNNFSSQIIASNYLISFIKSHFNGFLIKKNNHLPEDNFLELTPFLKNNTIIFINQISNSFHYQEVLELSKNNIIIAGFECYTSYQNPFHNFIDRYQRVSHLSINELSSHIHNMLYIQHQNNHYDYSILKKGNH